MQDYYLQVIFFKFQQHKVIDIIKLINLIFSKGIDAKSTNIPQSNPSLKAKPRISAETILSYSDKNSYYHKTSKFQNYSDRKFIIDEKKVGKVLSYIEPFDYSTLFKKNSRDKLYVQKQIKIPTIDLGKIKPRNGFDFINTNNFPPPNTYRPNFDLVKPRIQNGN